MLAASAREILNDGRLPLVKRKELQTACKTALIEYYDFIQNAQKTSVFVTTYPIPFEVSLVNLLWSVATENHSMAAVTIVASVKQKKRLFFNINNFLIQHDVQFDISHDLTDAERIFFRRYTLQLYQKIAHVLDLRVTNNSKRLTPYRLILLNMAFRYWLLSRSGQRDHTLPEDLIYLGYAYHYAEALGTEYVKVFALKNIELPYHYQDITKEEYLILYQRFVHDTRIAYILQRFDQFIAYPDRKL